MTLISGLRVALMRPKIRATASSVPTLVQPLPASSSIPDTAQVATPRDAAETSTRSRNLINQILLEFEGSRDGEFVEVQCTETRVSPCKRVVKPGVHHIPGGLRGSGGTRRWDAVARAVGWGSWACSSAGRRPTPPVARPTTSLPQRRTPDYDVATTT